MEEKSAEERKDRFGREGQTYWKVEIAICGERRCGERASERTRYECRPLSF